MLNGSMFMVYVWVLALIFFLKRYELKEYKNKAEFWGSKYSMLFFFGLMLSFFSIFLVNNFAPNEKGNIVSFQEVEELNVEDPAFKVGLENLEKDFTSLDKHIEFLKKYYDQPESSRKDLLLSQFYWDKTRFDDPEVVEIARWGETVVNTLLYDFSKFDFEAINQPKMISKPFSKLALGIYYRYQMQQPSSAHKLFLEEYKQQNLKTFKPLLKELLETANLQKDYQLCAEILTMSPELAYHSDDVEPNKIMFFGASIWDYLIHIIKRSYSDINLSGVIFALVIFFMWFYYLMKLDIYEKEKPIHIFLVALAGFMTAEIALPIYDYFSFVLHFKMNGSYWNDMAYCIFGIGFIEELVKLIPLLLLMIFTKEPNDTYDYLLYGSIAALAFATSENVMYFGDYRLAGYSGRSMYAVIMHLSCTSIAAYGWLLASFKRNILSKIAYVTLYFFTACMLHGLYDFFLFHPAPILFYLGFLGSVIVWIVMLNNSLNNSKFFSYEIAVKSTNLRMFIGIALTLLFVIEYVYYGFRDGKTQANQFFVSHAVGFALLTFFFTSKLAQFDLIRGFWRSVQWTDVASTRESNIFYPWQWPALIFRFFFNFFDLNSIRPQNYVGMTLKVFLANEKETFGPKWLNLKIIDRIVILNRNPTTKKIYRDPNWFVGLNTNDSGDFENSRFYLFKTETKNDHLGKNNRVVVELAVPLREEILSKHTISFNEIGSFLNGLASKANFENDKL